MNEAAERLRAWIIDAIAPFTKEQATVADLDAALAAERKATVERIRAALGPEPEHLNASGRRWAIERVLLILDAEAADAPA